MDFETFYRRYFDDVRRFAYGLTGNAADATTTAKGYLLTIAHNLWRDQQRRTRTSNEPIETLAEDRDPESSAIDAERAPRGW